MAGPHIRRNAGGAHTNDSGTPKLTIAVSRIPTPAMAQAPAPTPVPALASVSGPPGRYMDENLQRATKLALKLFVKGQEHDQLQANSALREHPQKARFSHLYYGNSHLNCYRFC